MKKECYFCLEKQTGAVDGFYYGENAKRDATEAAKMLSERWFSSQWLVCEVVGDYGHGSNLASNYHHGDKDMNQKLIEYFGDANG